MSANRTSSFATVRFGDYGGGALCGKRSVTLNRSFVKF